jgi:hypothetical protein
LAGLAQLGERQTEVKLRESLSEGHVFDPHKPHSFFYFLRPFPFGMQIILSANTPGTVNGDNVSFLCDSTSGCTMHALPALDLRQ